MAPSAPPPPPPLSNSTLRSQVHRRGSRAKLPSSLQFLVPELKLPPSWPCVQGGKLGALLESGGQSHRSQGYKRQVEQAILLHTGP